MLGFSQGFQNRTSRITKAWLNFTLSDGTQLEFHEDRVLFNGFVRDTSTTVDGQFTVGAAVTGKLTLNLDNTDDALSAYDFRGATVITWLGGEYTVFKAGIHPAEDAAGTQFTIAGLTVEQLRYFAVGAELDFGSIDGEHDIAKTYITAVSTLRDVTTITVHDAVTITQETYISVGATEKVNCGRYYVDEYTYDGANVTLVAYDDMSLFDVKCVDANISWSSSGKTISDLIDNCINVAQIGLWNSTLPGPSGYTIAQKPEQWDTMTLHDVIADCAQIMGCFAHIVYDTLASPATYKLKFEWYDVSNMSIDQYDGGTFDTTTTPYSDGAELDGGDFNYDDSEDSVNGGAFGDRNNIHIISSPFDLTVDTDDVLITGVTVTLDPSDNIEAGDDADIYTADLPIGESPDYVINISGNPLIETTSQADAVRDYIASVIVGMRFRPLSASVVENPAMEAGDVAIITGRKQNTYSCFLSHVTYTVNAATQVSCDATSTMQNLKSRYSGTQKTYALINRRFERSVSDVEMAMTGILGALATTMGLYDISETQADGSVIYMFGDAQTKAASTKIWRFSAGALTVSNDGGVTWNAALSAEGILVLQELYAVKVNAENIMTGTLTLGGSNNTNGQLRVLNANGVQIGQWNKDGIEAINMTAYGSLICYENYTIS